MISRLTAVASTFAVVIAATTALAFTAQAHAPAAPAAPVVKTTAVKIIELPRVVVVARRSER